MDIEAGLKEILGSRAFAVEPKTKSCSSWICVLKTTRVGDEGDTYKILETARPAFYEKKTELAAVIKEWDGCTAGYLLKVLKRIFRSKKVTPKKGTDWYRLDEADLTWLKDLRICNGGRHDGTFLDVEVIAFLGANTTAQLRKEGLYSR